MTNEIKYNCWSTDGETFNDNIGDVFDEFFAYTLDTYEEVLKAEIYAGVKVNPNITGIHIADNAIDYIIGQLYDLCGENADCYNVSEKDYEELKELMTSWTNKQDFRCWNAKNIKSIPVTNFLTKEEIKEYYE